MDYHVAKRRNAKAWDVLRKDAAGKLYCVSMARENLSRREAQNVARLLAGFSARVVMHDSTYPLSISFPDSAFAQSHI